MTQIQKDTALTKKGLRQTERERESNVSNRPIPVLQFRPRKEKKRRKPLRVFNDSALQHKEPNINTKSHKGEKDRETGFLRLFPTLPSLPRDQLTAHYILIH